MQVTLDVPDSLPQERLQQRIKELEESLQAEAKFLATVHVILDNTSARDSRAKQNWLGCMSGTGKITGDILAPLHGDLVFWEVLAA